MRGMQQRIAYLGPAGSYSEQAAWDWNPRAELVPVESIPAVSGAVVTGLADVGIVPIENSIEGGVTFTLDLLIHDSDLSICGEVIVPIHHCLMAQENIETDSIQTVLSHPQSLAQCREFLGQRLPNAEIIASLSNSRAVEEMMQSAPTTAAISSGRAAQLYQATILIKNVEDRSNNETRFVVLSNEDCERTGRDKTSVCFEYGGDAPGILSESLREFASRNINLVKIESRPNKRNLGRYVFFVDVEGHRNDASVSSALEALQAQTAMMKVLGSYSIKFREGE